jgi:mannose-6-phosphate isomerase-like protein (cupin superfamily)
MSADIVINEKMLKIFRLEEVVKKMPQAELPIEHSFCDGLYARTMRIPAFCLLSGAIHKEESFFLVREGVIALTTDDKEILAGPGFMSITKAGTKRMGFSFSECIVTTFHPNPTNEHDGDKIWDMYTMPAPGNILEMVKTMLLEDKE